MSRNNEVKIPKSVLSAVQKRKKLLTKTIKTILTNKQIGSTMRFTFLGDIVDHLKLFSLLENGQVKRAANFYIDLDTESREHIPNIIYNYLENYDVEKKYLD